MCATAIQQHGSIRSHKIPNPQRSPPLLPYLYARLAQPRRMSVQSKIVHSPISISSRLSQPISISSDSSPTRDPARFVYTQANRLTTPAHDRRRVTIEDLDLDPGAPSHSSGHISRASGRSSGHDSRVSGRSPGRGSRSASPDIERVKADVAQWREESLFYKSKCIKLEGQVKTWECVIFLPLFHKHY